MKIRTDFVTNSSSSSFVAITVEAETLRTYLRFKIIMIFGGEIIMLLPMYKKAIVGPTIESTGIIEANREAVEDGSLAIFCLRVITAEKIYVFRISANVWILEPEDFFQIVDGRLLAYGEEPINTVPELVTVLLSIAEIPIVPEVIQLAIDLKMGSANPEYCVNEMGKLLTELEEAYKEWKQINDTTMQSIVHNSIRILRAAKDTGLTGTDCEKCSLLFKAMDENARRVCPEYEEILNAADGLLNDIHSLKDIFVVESGILWHGWAYYGEEDGYDLEDPLDVEVNASELLGVEGENRMYIDFSELDYRRGGITGK